ncbi:MAG: adenosylcobinamide-GDP ribazoletransferase [Vicinamibacteria bacterium]
MRRLSAAISFLSRVPVPQRLGIDAVDVGGATIFFPLVGAAIGGVGALFLELSFLFPATLTALLVVAFWALVTGAMHLDGLADTADGLGGGRTREEKLSIMRDPSVGSYGVVTLILSLAVKVTALSTLIARGLAAPYLILAPTLGRWATVPLGYLLRYARGEAEGLGAALTGRVGWWDVLGATAIAAVIVFLAAGANGFFCWAVVVAVLGILGAWFQRSIGGVTGDTLGAACELCETAALVAAVGLTS